MLTITPLSNLSADIANMKIAEAYLWYSICEKCIGEMKDTIAAEERKMAELLTTEEILEAQKLASDDDKKPVQPTSLRFPRHPSATLKA